MEIPKYALESILNMDDSQVERFIRVLNISKTVDLRADFRGQIALDLNRRFKLDYPTLRIPLAEAIKLTNPSHIRTTKDMLRRRGIIPNDNRYQLILQLNTSRRTFPPFTSLPRELQTEVLTKLPLMERQITKVSKAMKELGDLALMKNIRANNLIDPTIGIYDRARFFKVDPTGVGEYFKPEPGLWPIIKNIRDHRVYDNDHYVLIYGLMSSTIMYEGPETQELVESLTVLAAYDAFKFVAMAWFNPSEYGETEFYYDERGELSMGLSEPMLEFNILDTKANRDILPEDTRTSTLRIHNISTKDIEQLTNDILDAKDQEITISDISIRLASAMNYKLLLPHQILFDEATVRIIHIPSKYITDGNLILPSLTENVYVLQ